MFKLAILSDAHADMHTLEDALAQVDELGCDAIACAGDIAAYDPNAPAPVLRPL